MPQEFVVPGETQLSAALDVARTVVRRAERVAVGYHLEDSLVIDVPQSAERPRLDDGALGRGTRNTEPPGIQQLREDAMARSARVTSMSDALTQPTIAVPVIFR